MRVREFFGMQLLSGFIKYLILMFISWYPMSVAHNALHLPFLQLRITDLQEFRNDSLNQCDDLSELPVTELLLRQRTPRFVNGSELPIASPLINPLNHMQVREPPVRRGQWVEEMEEEEEEEEMEWMPSSKGKGKIAKIFDMSVTALAFLAFGGYLLCLVVHAIKDKQNMTTVSPITRPVLPFLSPSGSFQLPPLRPGRRRRDIDPNDDTLNQLIDSGLLFAEELILLNQ